MSLIAYDTQILDVLRSKGLMESNARPTVEQVKALLEENNIKGVVKVEGGDVIVKRLLVDHFSKNFQYL